MARKRRSVKTDNGYRFPRTNAASAANGAPPKFYITHGGQSALLKDPLDKRSAMYRRYTERLTAYTAHVGGDDATAVQLALAETTSRLSLLVDLSWAELLRTGLITEGGPAPAVNVFLRSVKQYQEGLLHLGVQRHRKQIKLSDYLEGKVSPSIETYHDEPAELASAEDHDL